MQAEKVKTMHMCSLENENMQKIENAIKQHGELTTHQIGQMTGLEAVSTYISMLRKRGRPISKARRLDTPGSSRKVFSYRWEGGAA